MAGEERISERPVWEPTPDGIARSRLYAFMQRYGARDYSALHAWSVAEPAAFWSAVWRDCGVKAHSDYTAPLTDEHRMPGARWFEGATLNYAENLLVHRGSECAIVSYSETGERAELSRDALADRVLRVAAALESLGVGRGDRVVGVLPNRSETVIAMLATATLGAIWSSCSPDFGTEAILDRFAELAPKVLFAVDGYHYNGKRIDIRDKVAAVANGISGLHRIVLLPVLTPVPQLASHVVTLHFTELLAASARAEFTPVAFGDAAFILHSSGTTGRPKCIVHSAGGTLLQHLKEHQLHTDIQPGDVVFYFTTCGWMMWNWLVSALASGARLVLFDGSPFHPDPGILWRIAEQERVDVFGTSAKYLSALEKANYRPGAALRLPALRTILSTGSPIAPSSYDYARDAIKRDVQVCSISGGTEIISCFALGNPLLPVFRGELQCMGLGMRVEIFDERGRALGHGRPGELVCTAPFPSMPIGFWNDPSGEKYRAAYFDRFPGVWHHGDYAELTSRGSLIIYGRSDAVLNPGGVRIGTAEIYRVVERCPEVIESIAVAQDWDNDVRVVLFVRLQPGITLDTELTERLRRHIRTEASPRHVPAKILAVSDMPRTINGKLVELAVRDAIHGRPIANLAVLANPEALEGFKNRPELAEA